MFAKHYENPTMLSRVTAKNVQDVFLRHTVYTYLLLDGTVGISSLCISAKKKEKRKETHAEM